MDEQELFDVISSTLTEKGFIQTWKSELMYRAVQPLYESSVLPRISIENGENSDRQRNLLKLRILADFLDRLGLENTKQMLLTEVDAKEEELEAGIANLPVPENNEPYLNALWRIAGSGFMDKHAHDDDTDQDLPSLNDSGDQEASNKDIEDDLFQTAISKLEDELDQTIIKEDGQGDGPAQEGLSQ